MKQKNLFLGFIIFAISGVLTSAYAKTVAVESLSNFSTANPPASISIKLLEPIDLDAKTIVEAGAIMQGKLVDVESPKRLKRDAKFSFVPTSYKTSEGNPVIVHHEVVAKYKKPTNPKKIVKSAALGVGGFFVKGLSTGVAAVEGAVKNEEGNVLKSTAVSVYQASPIAYVEKGQDLEIKNNQVFYLKFPSVNDTDIDIDDEE